MNFADHLRAAASPSNLDGSSAGLLLLGTLSIHQKDGKWTSTEKNALTRSSMVWLLDRPLTTPPLAELLSTNKMTLRLDNSSFHCHLTRTMVKSSIWQIRWSPTRSFHSTRRSGWTLSWTTRLTPLDSSSITAPMPATPFSHDPSVKIKMVLVFMPKGIILGWTLSSKTNTSSHHLFKWGDFEPPLSIKEKILKHAYLRARPAKYPVAKFSNPWISWASAKVIWPASWTLLIFEEIFWTLPSLFPSVRVWLCGSPESCMDIPRTSKVDWNGFPFGPVRSCLHPSRSKKSDTKASVSVAALLGENIGKSK